MEGFGPTRQPKRMVWRPRRRRGLVHHETGGSVPTGENRAQCGSKNSHLFPSIPCWNGRSYEKRGLSAVPVSA